MPQRKSRRPPPRATKFSRRSAAVVRTVTFNTSLGLRTARFSRKETTPNGMIQFHPTPQDRGLPFGGRFWLDPDDIVSYGSEPTAASRAPRKRNARSEAPDDEKIALQVTKLAKSQALRKFLRGSPLTFQDALDFWGARTPHTAANRAASLERELPLVLERMNERDPAYSGRDFPPISTVYGLLNLSRLMRGRFAAELEGPPSASAPHQKRSRKANAKRSGIGATRAKAAAGPNEGVVARFKLLRGAGPGEFFAGGRKHIGDYWSYVDVFDRNGRPVGGGEAVFDEAAHVMWLADYADDTPPRSDGVEYVVTGRVYRGASWRDRGGGQVAVGVRRKHDGDD